MTGEQRPADSRAPRVEDALIDEGAYRASTRFSNGNGGSHYFRIDPVETNDDWLFLEVPSISGARADIDVFDGATLSTSSTISTLHNINYAGPEQPNASIVEATDSATLDTSSAHQTEETEIPSGGNIYRDTASAARQWWRIIPPNEDITIRVTNQSGGTVSYVFNIVLYERSDWPNQDLL